MADRELGELGALEKLGQVRLAVEGGRLPGEKATAESFAKVFVRGVAAGCFVTAASGQPNFAIGRQRLNGRAKSTLLTNLRAATVTVAMKARPEAWSRSSRSPGRSGGA